MLINSETLDLYVFISRNVMPVAKTDLACPTSGAFDSKVGQSHRVDVSPHGSSFLFIYCWECALYTSFLHKTPCLFVCLFEHLLPCRSVSDKHFSYRYRKTCMGYFNPNREGKIFANFFRREYVYCKKKNYIYINITYTV